MAFDIGNVVSPQVAAALIRRGENRGGGGFSRRDPIKRTTTTNTEDADRTAFDRESRLQELQDAQLDRADRQDAFSRERFEAGLEEKEKDREISKGNAEAKGAAARSATESRARNNVTSIIKDIGKALAAGNKRGDDGQPDPAAQKIAQQTVAALWGQLQNMGLPKAELAALAQSLKAQLPQTAAPRSGGGMERGSIPGLPANVKDNGDGTATLPNGKTLPIEQILANAGIAPGGNQGNFSRGAGGPSKVESGLARELGTPTRTP